MTDPATLLAILAVGQFGGGSLTERRQGSGMTDESAMIVYSAEYMGGPRAEALEFVVHKHGSSESALAEAVRWARGIGARNFEAALVEQTAQSMLFVGDFDDAVAIARDADRLAAAADLGLHRCVGP